MTVARVGEPTPAFAPCSTTEAGRAERVELDRRSDALAGIRCSSRSATGSAVAWSRRWARSRGCSTPASSQVERRRCRLRRRQACLAAYYDELARRFPGGFDPGRSLHPDTHEFTEPTGLFVLARLHGRAIGCGAVLFHDDAPAYVKRMWVDDAVRGMGVGRRILVALEQAARDHGAASVTLETNASLTEAIAMYRASGYVEVEPFNDEVYADHWFAKPLA